MTKPFTTPDLGLAAYLLYSGMEVLRPIETKTPGKYEIVFIDSDERARFVEEYIAKESTVIPKQYAKCVHEISKLIRKGPFRA